MRVAGINVDLPKGWHWVKCSDVVDVRDGTHDTPKYVTSGYPLVTSKNLKPEGIDFSEISYISQADHLEICKRSRVDKGDILFAMIGTIGNPTVVDTDIEFSIKNVALFKFSQKSIDTNYFRHLLAAPIIKRQLKAEQRGGTQQFVSLKVLRNMMIPYPPIAEQRRIAAILDRADAVRRKRQEAIALTEELLRSAFLEMFGDPVTNPKGWETDELESVCRRITDGTHQPPEWASKGVPFLFVSNIVHGEIDFNVTKYITEQSWTSLTARCPIEINDILYTTVGSYGNAALIRTKKRFCFQRHIAHIKPNPEILHPEFLLGLMQSNGIKRQADRQVRGVAQKTLNLRELKRFQVLVPPMLEQEKYVAFRRRVEDSANKQQNDFEFQNDLFNSLLQRAFQGEL